MAKSIKLKNDTYWDSSSVVYGRVPIDTYVGYLSGKRSTIKFDATTGWKRIAILKGQCNGELVIINPNSYGTVGKIRFGASSGWETFLDKVYKCIANGHYFTKVRMVYKGNSISYLEIYQNLAYERTVSLYLDIPSVGVWLYTTQVMGEVPSGYNTKEITF